MTGNMCDTCCAFCDQSFSSIFESVIKGLGTAFRETVENLTEAEFDLVVAGVRFTRKVAGSLSIELQTATPQLHTWSGRNVWLKDPM